MFRQFIIFVIILTLQNVCIADDFEVPKSHLYKNNCINKVTCGECIKTNNCAWCMQPDYGDRPRCFQPILSLAGICPEKYTWNPDSEQVLTMNRELTRAGASTAGGGMMSGGNWEENSSSSSGSSGASFGNNIVQISPQRVGLKVRIDQMKKLEVKFSQAEDFPVDLYFLIDLSKSMESDIDKIQKLGDLLSASLRNITSKFRIGFGTFGAKVAEDFDYSSSFEHVMPLSSNLEEFSTTVKIAIDSTRLGPPKPFLDALIQVTACPRNIGWREQAKRILVVSTNAGVPTTNELFNQTKRPNDGLCHLAPNGLYTHSHIQDYPSISQINLKVKEYDFNIIFAVTSQQFGAYKKLAEHIEGSSIGVLSNDSSNVVELVKAQYNMISTTVVMKNNAMSEVQQTYYSACLGDTPIVTNKCDGLKIGDVVSFTVEILVTSCPKNPKDWFQTFEIYPVGIPESLIVDLQLLCDCPCERPGHFAYEPFSPKCYMSGTFKCGVCECDETHFGRNCECSTIVNLAEAGCRPDNVTEIDCNGRGNCACGVCECDKRANPEEIIVGRFCECDNFSCDRHNGLVCSGPEHGICECGKCVCRPGWTGSVCDGKTTNDSCMPADGGAMCSGHGECISGACRCETVNGNRYSGRFCEACATCQVFMEPKN